MTEVADESNTRRSLFRSRTKKETGSLADDDGLGTLTRSPREARCSAPCYSECCHDSGRRTFEGSCSASFFFCFFHPERGRKKMLRQASRQTYVVVGSGARRRRLAYRGRDQAVRFSRLSRDRLVGKQPTLSGSIPPGTASLVESHERALPTFLAALLGGFDFLAFSFMLSFRIIPRVGLHGYVHERRVTTAAALL